jgi:histidinol dehydrogenase
MGGPHAIAAMAFGTESVRKVDKIFGPGSAWVTAAKQMVAADLGRGHRSAGRASEVW